MEIHPISLVRNEIHSDQLSQAEYHSEQYVFFFLLVNVSPTCQPGKNCPPPRAWHQPLGHRRRRHPPASSPVTEPTTTATTVAATAPATTPPAATTPKVALARTLETGARGDDVAMLQQRLKDLAFDPGTVDGSLRSGYGPGRLGIREAGAG